MEVRCEVGNCHTPWETVRKQPGGDSAFRIEGWRQPFGSGQHPALGLQGVVKWGRVDRGEKRTKAWPWGTST